MPKLKTYATYSGDNTGRGGNYVRGNLELPANPKDGNVEYTLVAVGRYGFRNNGYLGRVGLPSTVTEIGGYAILDQKHFADA